MTLKHCRSIKWMSIESSSLATLTWAYQRYQQLTHSCNLLSFCFSMSKTSSKTTSPSQTLEKCLLCTSNASLLILEPWGKKPSCDLACNIIASQPQTKNSTVLLYVECKRDHRQVSTLDSSTVTLSDVGNSTLCCMCVLCTCPTFTYNSLQLTNYKEAKLKMETNKQGGINKPHECEVYHKWFNRKASLWS